jgi:hypothetical protein
LLPAGPTPSVRRGSAARDRVAHAQHTPTSPLRGRRPRRARPRCIRRRQPAKANRCRHPSIHRRARRPRRLSVARRSALRIQAPAEDPAVSPRRRAPAACFVSPLYVRGVQTTPALYVLDTVSRVEHTASVTSSAPALATSCAMVCNLGYCTPGSRPAQCAHRSRWSWASCIMIPGASPICVHGSESSLFAAITSSMSVHGAISAHGASRLVDHTGLVLTRLRMRALRLVTEHAGDMRAGYAC